MRDLEERLHEADDLAPPDLWSEVERRSQRSAPAGGRVGTIVFALALSAVAVGALVVAFAHWTGDRPPGNATGQQPTVIGASVERQIPVGGPPTEVALGDGSVWVLVSGTSDASDKLVRIDASSDAVTGEIPLHGLADSVAADEQSAWVSLHEGVEGVSQTSASVLRIDPNTNEVAARIPDMGGPLTMGSGSVWGSIRTPGGSDLLQLDPATEDITSRAHLTVIVRHMVFIDGVLWAVGVDPATDDVNGIVLRIDPASGEWTRIATPVEGTLYGPVAGAGRVWVGICCPSDGNSVVVVPFDATTGLPVNDPVPVGDGLPFAEGFGNLWLLSDRGTLFGLNESTLERKRYLQSDWPAGNTTAALDEPAGAVWVANLQPTVTKLKLKEAS
jgi:hypothetical protein